MAGNKNLVLSLLIEATNAASGVINQVSGSLNRLQQQLQKIDQQAYAFDRAGSALARASVATGAAAAAIILPLRGAMDDWAELQQHIGHVGVAMDEIGTVKVQHLEAVKKASQDLAKSMGVTSEAAADAYYIERSNMLSHVQAMSATTEATKLAIATTMDLKEAQEELPSVARLMTAVYNDYGNKAKNATHEMQHLADQMAKLQTQYAFKNIGEVQYAYNYALPVAKGAGVNFSDMNTMLALISSSGLYGAEAGTAFEELLMKLQSDKKLIPFAARNAHGGIDVGASVKRLAEKFGSMPPAMRQLMLAQLGFAERSGKSLSLVIDKIKEYDKIKHDLDTTPLGFADEKAAARTKEFWNQLEILGQSIRTLKEDIGGTFAPVLAKLLPNITRVVNAIDAWVNRHPQLAKFIAYMAIGAAALLTVISVLTAAAAAVAFFLGGLTVIGGVFAAMAGFAAPALTTIMAVAGAIAGLGAVIVGLVSAGAVWAPGILKGIAGSLWSAVSILPRVLSAVWGLYSRMFDAGVNLMVQLGKGMLSAIMHPIAAATKVAAAIKDFLRRTQPSAGRTAAPDRE